MRIAISGASGFVGRQLVPLLVKKGVDLLLISRDPPKLQDLFPQLASCGVSQLRSPLKSLKIKKANFTFYQLLRPRVDVVKTGCRRSPSKIQKYSKRRKFLVTV